MAKILRWFACVLLFSLVISGIEHKSTKTETDPDAPSTTVIDDKTESSETTDENPGSVKNSLKSKASAGVISTDNSENITSTTSDFEEERNKATSTVSVPKSTTPNKESPISTHKTVNSTTNSNVQTNTKNNSTTNSTVQTNTKNNSTTNSTVQTNTKNNSTTNSTVQTNTKNNSTTNSTVQTNTKNNSTTGTLASTKKAEEKTTPSPVPTKTTVKQEKNSHLPISDDSSENKDIDNEAISDVNDLSRGPSENAGINTDLSSLNPESEPEGHFMAYFLTAVVLCVAGYVIFHNKQKIVAFIVEGRTGRKSSRRPSKGGYRKLKPSADDLMPSLEKSTTSTSYVY